MRANDQIISSDRVEHVLVRPPNEGDGTAFDGGQKMAGSGPPDFAPVQGDRSSSQD